MMETKSAARGAAPYRYRPVLFFALAYLFTWIFWVPAIFAPENLGAALMLVGLLAPAVVSTVFVLVSKSELLKKDLKIKLIGLYKVKWRNVLLAVVQFAGIVVCSILACMIYHLFVNFLQEKIAMTPETKCVETIVVIIVAAIIVLTNKDMFFETRHVGRLLEARYGEAAEAGFSSPVLAEGSGEVL